MLEISNNSSSIFRSCQMKYKWNYIEGLKPIRKTNVLSLGSIIHKAFEIYYGQTGDAYKYIQEETDRLIAIAPPEDVEDLTIMKYTLLGMWHYSPFKVSDFKSVEPEMEFKVRLPGTHGIVFVGKIDGLVMDLNGRTWVRELKTTAQPFSLFEVRSRQSAQGTGYIWAMRQLGKPVEGVLYDYVKKPLLRKGVNETMDGYGQRIMYDYGNRPDVYYKRHPSYRSDEELRLFEADLRRVAFDIRKRTHDNAWHRNSDQCWNYNSECPYLKICFKEKPDPMTIQVYFDKQTTSNKGGLNARTNGGSAGGGSDRGGEGGGTDSIPVGHGVDIGCAETVD